MPAGYTGATNTARLLSLFSMSDIQKIPGPDILLRLEHGFEQTNLESNSACCTFEPILMAGHRHINTVTPQPSPDPAYPEYGFWEMDCSIVFAAAA